MVKLAILNTGIAVANVAIFSQGFLGVKLNGTSAFQSALGYTAIVMSVILFAYGNYTLLIQKVKVAPDSEIKSIEDCIDILQQIEGKEAFEKDINTMKSQLKRLEQKKGVIEDVILQKFNPTELSYAKFHRAVVGIENVFLTNIRSILNKINAFDQEEYDNIVEKDSRIQTSSNIMQTKLNIYNEYISYVRESTEDNEEILIKLDMFMLELSKLNSLENGDILNMPELKEMEDIIDKTKLYK